MVDSSNAIHCLDRIMRGLIDYAQIHFKGMPDGAALNSCRYLTFETAFLDISARTRRYFVGILGLLKSLSTVAAILVVFHSVKLQHDISRKAMLD